VESSIKTVILSWALFHGISKIRGPRVAKFSDFNFQTLVRGAPVTCVYVREVRDLPGFISRELMKWLKVYEMFTLAVCNEYATSNTAARVVFIRVAVACRPFSSSSSFHMAVERQLLTHHLISLVTTLEEWHNSIRRFSQLMRPQKI
jgi:hypothetical protein